MNSANFFIENLRRFKVKPTDLPQHDFAFLQELFQ